MTLTDRLARYLNHQICSYLQLFTFVFAVHPICFSTCRKQWTNLVVIHSPEGVTVACLQKISGVGQYK